MGDERKLSVSRDHEGVSEQVLLDGAQCQRFLWRDFLAQYAQVMFQ